MHADGQSPGLKFFLEGLLAWLLKIKEGILDSDGRRWGGPPENAIPSPMARNSGKP